MGRGGMNKMNAAAHASSRRARVGANEHVRHYPQDMMENTGRKKRAVRTEGEPVLSFGWEFGCFPFFFI